MNDTHMLIAMQEMLYFVVIGVCVVTLPILILGVILSVLQAATQVNEMTLTFIPKFVLMFTILFVLSPWLMTKLVGLMQKYLLNLPDYIR